MPPAVDANTRADAQVSTGRDRVMKKTRGFNACYTPCSSSAPTSQQLSQYRPTIEAEPSKSEHHGKGKYHVGTAIATGKSEGIVLYRLYRSPRDGVLNFHFRDGCVGSDMESCVVSSCRRDL